MCDKIPYIESLVIDKDLLWLDNEKIRVEEIIAWYVEERRERGNINNIWKLNRVIQDNESTLEYIKEARERLLKILETK